MTVSRWSLEWEQRRRCACEMMGCDECGGSGWIHLPLPEFNFRWTRAGDLLAPIFGTIKANMERAEQTGYELTEDEISPAEITLAHALTAARISYEQQHRVGPFFADFYIPEARLVVEVDGDAYHADEEKDDRRTAYMLEHGISSVLRIRALRVFTDPEGCADEIAKLLA